MPDTVPVTIEVDPGAAAALADARTRAAVGRLVSRVLAHETEAPDRSDTAGRDDQLQGPVLAAAFRSFRRGRRLGGLDPRTLIREGLA